MKLINYETLINNKYGEGAIERSDFPGFHEDYMAIQAIIRRLPLNTFLEIGTSSGNGTLVIANALGIKAWNKFISSSKKLYSIDVPPGTDPKIIYPGGEDGHPAKAGAACYLPYKQIYGDSTKYDFTTVYPLDGWFIDGKHNYQYAKKDTLQALKSKPMLLIWHDKQILGVKKAILEVMKNKKNYVLLDVKNTRIIAAVKKEYENLF